MKTPEIKNLLADKLGFRDLGFEVSNMFDPYQEFYTMCRKREDGFNDNIGFGFKKLRATLWLR